MPSRIPRPARARHAAAFLAALALALPVRAAQKTPSSTRAKTRVTAPRAVPEPASTPVASDIPLPPPPTVSRASRGQSSIGIGLGAWSGFDIGKGFAAHIDYGFDRTPASWRRLALEWRLAVMFSRPTEEKDLTMVVGGYPPAPIVSGVEKTSAYVVEVAPTARVRLSMNEKLALFGDAGLGVAQSVETYERDEMYIGLTVQKENVTGLVFRAGLGVSLDVSERTRLLFLPVALSIQIGPGYSAYEPTLAVAFRL